jgi:acetate---CoA ligase (ADP-forming)
VRPGQIDTETVQMLVSRTLDGAPEGAWLTAEESATLLGAYGIPLATARVVTDAAGAATAQREIGRPVAVKLAAAVHKRDVGGVVLSVGTPDDAAAAVATIEGELRDHRRSDLAGRYLVQEMVGDGVEVLVGLTHDPSCGPLVMVGLGGTLVELLRDVAVRITPLTDVDVDEMLASLKTAPLLTGYRGSAPVDVPALRDLLFRISALVEDVPEIRELDLNPVFVRTQGLVAVDARIRVAR